MNLNLTLLGQSITFAFFVWFCMKYVWPPLTAAISERQKKIADGLAAATQGEEALEKAKQEIASQLLTAKQKAAEVLDSANTRANQIIADAKDKAKQEGERLLQIARADIEKESEALKDNLRAEVVSIALLGAEKVLEKTIDKTAHEKMLEQLAANM